MHNYCRSLTDALDNFSYHPLTGDPAPAGESVQRIIADHPDLGAFDVYVAGPENFANTASRVFLASGLPSERLFRYSPAS